MHFLLHNKLILHRLIATNRGLPELAEDTERHECLHRACRLASPWQQCDVGGHVTNDERIEEEDYDAVVIHHF